MENRLWRLARQAYLASKWIRVNDGEVVEEYFDSWPETPTACIVATPMQLVFSVSTTGVITPVYDALK